MIQQFHVFVYIRKNKIRVSNRYVVIAALFTIAKRWKQLKCPPMDDWLNKMWYIHVMEYYSALKRKEILTVLCQVI